MSMARHHAEWLLLVEVSASLCAEHSPLTEMVILHTDACHACLFVPETSCERGNNYLDRSLLVPTIEHADLAFFSPAAN